MIIKELHIDGFGLFRDFSLEGLERGVNVILGNNEAGKSTLLKFIRYTLFDYPVRHADRMQPLQGGSHGGRIIGRLASGEEVVFDRRGDREILVTYQGNPSGNQRLWDQLLGHAHRDLYNNIYSFTLDELTGIGSLDESGMQDKIFSVGLGLGKTSIGDITGTLAENADKTYKRRGRVHAVASILGEIDQISRRIATIRMGLPEYERLEREIAEKQDDLSRLLEQTETWRRERDRLEINLRCYESFLTLSAADGVLETLPALAGYPENGPEELQRIEQDHQGLQSRLGELKEGSGEEAGMNELEKEIGRISFNAELLAEAEEVKSLERKLEAYRVNVAENEKDSSRVTEMEQAISSGIREISGTWTREDILRFPELSIHRDRIREFMERFGMVADRKRTLEAKADAMISGRSSVNMKVVALLVFLFLLSGAGLLFFYSAYVPGAVTLLLALLTFFSRRYLVRVGPENSLDQQMKDLRDEEDKLKQSYSHYISEQLKLPPFINPDTASKALDQIASLKKLIEEQQQVRDRVERERTPKIEDFEARAGRLGKRLTDPPADGNMEVLVGSIIREYENSRSLSEKRQRLEEDLGRKRRECSRIGSAMEELEKRKQDLFDSIAADDRQDFLEKYRVNDRVRVLLEQRKAAVRNMEMVAGHNRSGEVIACLERQEKPSIEQQVRELSSRISEAEEQYNSLREQVGKAKSELERLEGQSDLAESLTELESRRHLLRNAYREWLVNRTALVLLEQVKGRYEKEKQPELIKSSGAFLETITSGRYNGIHVSMDDRQILVSDPRGAVKRIEQLSRGTREQMLISLRLGLIQEYERRSEPLPVVIDEVLVNFDPERARQVAAILEEFAEERQVLVFTCHPSTLDSFDQVARKIVLE